MQVAPGAFAQAPHGPYGHGCRITHIEKATAHLSYFVHIHPNTLVGGPLVPDLVGHHSRVTLESPPLAFPAHIAAGSHCADDPEKGGYTRRVACTVFSGLAQRAFKGDGVWQQVIWQTEDRVDAFHFLAFNVQFHRPRPSILQDESGAGGRRHIDLPTRAVCPVLDHPAALVFRRGAEGGVLAISAVYGPRDDHKIGSGWGRILGHAAATARSLNAMHNKRVGFDSNHPQARAKERERVLTPIHAEVEESSSWSVIRSGLKDAPHAVLWVCVVARFISIGSDCEFVNVNRLLGQR